ncbi:MULTISPECIES: transcriptional regulator FtrA [unclassified Bradyrhizobium]|uniref:transcriptional regulator FtrA n=1 Tax=unclassified Bradyrhizobium TaxID=2631580 RepID=UPI0004656D7E|nr:MULTISPECIES: transcriptional regulator FtrA [unclassified Bradyrhizobium]OCX29959.1 transcriptional regulator [Bradyrhizobium sp. UASWS1016]
MTYIVNIVPNSQHTKPAGRARRDSARNRVVALLAYDGVNAFELGMALEVFGLPNMGRDWYRVAVCAERPGVPVAAGAGVKIVADVDFSFLSQAGTIIVPGWQDIEASPPEAVVTALRRAHARGVRIASICSGVFVLAGAGLLEGRRVAAHWAHAEPLVHRHPALRVDAKVLYVDDGDIMSSAGRAAGLDLCIHIVRKDFGPEIANDVARRLVIPAHREGGQAQFIPNPVVLADGDPLAELCAWMRRHLDRDLTIEGLAGRARMSRRTFIRRFETATGMSPGEWVLQERMTRARDLLEATAMSVEDVATAVGFGTADALRHHFRTRLDTSPMRYRLDFAPKARPPLKAGQRS